MTVTFVSEWEETALQLFDRAFTRTDEGTDPIISTTGRQIHYHFASDTLIRDVRSWGADAIGCGLLTSFSISVSY